MRGKLGLVRGRGIGSEKGRNSIFILHNILVLKKGLRRRKGKKIKPLNLGGKKPMHHSE